MIDGRCFISIDEIDVFHASMFDSSFFLLAVDQRQLDRAKESTKSAVLMNLESRVCFYLLFIF